MSRALYKVENLIHHYNRQPVVNIEDLTIKPASITGLAGPNGSGKSTLLKLMAFIMRPSKGRILINGHPAFPFDETVRSQVTLLTQEPYLMRRTVFNNIAYGLKVRGDRKDWIEPVHEALTMVGLDPDRFSNRYWNELSGGEAQRVALAARLVLKPRVLLLDEPTASVDAASSELIRTASLSARSEWGTTLVIASHDREWLYDVCDEVIHLFEGKVVGTGRSNMIFGPWVSGPGDRHYKDLGDGKRLPVSMPPHTEATAFIDPGAIQLLARDEAQARSGRVLVNGTVTRLSLEKERGQLLADVRVGTHSLAVRVDESHLAAMTLHRGWPVTLAYRLDSIQWR